MFVLRCRTGYTAKLPQRVIHTDIYSERNRKVAPRGRATIYTPANGSSTVAKFAADLRPSADGYAVRTSMVASGG